MKTSVSSADKENVLSSRRFQENTNAGLRSQSTDQPFRGSASLGFKNMNINIPQAMSPQALSHSNSFSQLKGKILDDQTEAFQKRIAYLQSENEKLHKTNTDLTQENEGLKKKEAPSAEDKELTEKLGLILAENAKLNFALEKLRETYQKERAQNEKFSELASQPELHPSDLNVDQKMNSKGFESMMSNQSTPFMGNKARSRTEHSEARSNITKKDEEYEKTILTLFVENDKLNDALEQKMKEVQTLSSKLDTVKASQIVANGENKNKLQEIAEENTSLSVSQDLSGMVNNLLQENAKLIEIIHKKDQELKEFGSKPKNLDESFGKSEEENETAETTTTTTKNPTLKKIMSSQNRILTEFKQSSSIVNQFKVSTTNLIEENLKINQLISDRMNSLKEDFSHAVGALPADVYQLQAQVELLSQEKEELNNIIKEQLVEIGSLRQQVSSGPKSQETRSEVYGMSLTTTDGTINYDEQGNRITSLTDMDKDREFHNLKNMIIDIDSNSNVQREQLEDVQNRIEGLFVGLQTIVNGGRVEFEDVAQTGQNEDFDGLKSNFSDIKAGLIEILQGMKREESARAQMSALLQENQKANQTIKEKERMVESLVNQLKKLQEGYGELMKQSMQAKDYDGDFANVLQRVEDIHESMGNMSEEKTAENREIKNTVGFVLSELNQFKKDFVNYHHELKALKNLTSTNEQNKRTIAEEEERLKGAIHNLMQEKEQLYSALRQKDGEFEQIRQQKYDLSEKLNFISNENKNFVRIMKDKEKEIGNLHNQVMELENAHERLIEIQRQKEEAAAMEMPEEPSKSVVETSFSEESTPVKVQIKRRPLTEEEKIVQENFQGKIDIVFCLDCTRSMDPYILNAKLACEKIMTVMNQSKNTFPLDLMFGFVGYRDHGSFNGGTWVTKVQDLCDIETCMKFINKMDAQSSNDNDFPEAVMPALWDCCEKISWRDNSKEKVLRVVFHIADAPPHGKRFYKGKNDKYPKGDPSGIRTDQIAQRFADMGISYKLLKIGKFLDLMEKIFKQTFLDIDSMELKKAEHLDQMTTTILVKQLDAINNEVSIKDKRFLKVMPKGNIKRSEKAGQCYFTSILFDDYLEYFMEENITDFRVRTLNIFHSQEAIVGVQCVYVTEDEEIEAPARIAHNQNLRQASIEFAPKEYITEISGELDQKENLTSLTIVTSMNKRIKVGAEGVRKFRVNVPPSGYVLAGVGGSFRNRGIDSIYFYYI